MSTKKEAFHYEVRRAGQTLMQTDNQSCRYDAGYEKNLMAAGCDIFVNGKRLTKKATKTVATKTSEKETKIASKTTAKTTKRTTKT